MHGFFGSYGVATNWDLSTYSDKSFIIREHCEKRIKVTQVTLSQFLDDKYFTETDECFLAVEGVLFEADNPSDAIQRYLKGEITFWDSWRGSFCGLLYDKRTDKLLIFNDHIGSKILFYTQTKEGFIFASDLCILATAVNAHTLNNDYALTMLNEGFSGTAQTFIRGIFRIIAGQYLCIQGSQLISFQYHHFDNTPYVYNEEEMLKETDRLFRQAVARVIKKNEQEGLRHFFPLSGGLDSRMTQWIARQLTNQPITNFTFSQTGHYDHLLPQEISRTLGNTWQFLPLDGGEYITDVDGVCERTEWLVNYMLPIEIDYFSRQQKWHNTGVVLTGINGDNIFAAGSANEVEMERIYTQGFSGYSLGSPLIMQYYTETYSPFCDVDVLDYVLHVPTSKRRNYYFYDRWILTYYPEAAQWHHKYMKIGHRPKMITLLGRNIPLHEVGKRIVMSILKRLHIYDAYRATKKDSMNPYDFWVIENPAILEQIHLYYNKYCNLISQYSWFDICKEKMRIGTIMEKGKVLTIQSAIVHLNLH